MRFATLMLVIATCAVPALAGSSALPLATYAANAVSANPSLAEPAIIALRARGAEGLATLLDTHRTAIDAVRRGDTTPANWERLRMAIDRVAAQRDAYASELFWHTDLAAALAESRATGKPVLSLRLLGRLDEELSCANSRFFRTALYAHAGVSARMRENFVLHWSSERPVPRITIDFGDGRRIESTITGNSAHYVLDAKGRVVDVIPGLYGPAAFLRELDTAGGQAKRVSGLGAADWKDAQMAYWQERAVTAEGEWDAMATRAGAAPKVELQPDARGVSAQAADPMQAGNPPSATVAAVLVVGKRAVEAPIVREIDLAPLPDVSAAYDRTVRAIVPFVYGESRLDAGGVAMLERHVEPGSDLELVRRNFEVAIASDTVLNRYRIHPMVLGLLMRMPEAEFTAINRTIYDEVFQTPASDPWLGLKPMGVYTALEPRVERTK